MVTPTPTYQQPPVAANADSKGIVPIVNGEPAGTVANPISVNVVGGGLTGGATESTLEAVESLLATPATVLPPTPLMAPGDFTGTFILNSTSNTDITIAAAAGVNVKTRAYRALFTITGAATEILIYDDVSASGNIVARYDFPATGGVIDFESSRARWKSAANKPLVMKQNGGAQLSGTIDYGQSTVA